MKANARDIRTALERPSPDIRLYLLHGPDGSAAAELAGVLAKAMGAEAERVDLDGAQLRSDPARLADEAASLSLFGGARYIRVSPAGEECLDAFIAADNAEAKARVSALLESLGLRPLDVGGLHMAQTLEALGLMMIGLAKNGARTWDFAMKVDIA